MATLVLGAALVRGSAGGRGDRCDRANRGGDGAANARAARRTAAAILLEAIAPDLMVGWPSPLSDEARALLPPEAAEAAADTAADRTRGRDQRAQALDPSHRGLWDSRPPLR